MTHQTPAVYPINLDHVPEIKLIACDMDGTLLDDDRAIHEDFWPLIDQLHARGTYSARPAVGSITTSWSASNRLPIR